MSTEPTVELATGELRLDRYVDPLLVDPDPSLLMATAEATSAWTEATSAWTEVTSARTEVTSATMGSDETPPGGDPETHGIVALSVLARKSVLEAVTDGFRRAGRVARAVEAERVRLYTLETSQPNALLLGRTSGVVIVSTPGGRYAFETPEDLRERYEPIRAEAEPFRLRTPSPNRIREAFVSRCDGTLADDVVALLEAGPDPADDVVDPRIRAYLAGARHGVDDYALRRACEEAGLGSPSTFTGVKRRLVDANLVATERVPTPVGRPRKRIRPGPALADAPFEDVLAVARAALASAEGDADGDHSAEGDGGGDNPAEDDHPGDGEDGTHPADVQIDREP